MVSNEARYYHYTSAESADKIDKSKVIIGSTQEKSRCFSWGWCLFNRQEGGRLYENTNRQK